VLLGDTHSRFMASRWGGRRACEDSWPEFCCWSGRGQRADRKLSWR
jgi:hypothetical protein